MEQFQIRPLSTEQVIPAGCQGIIGVECRQKDRELVRLLQQISDPETWRRFQWERQLFTSMKVDCSRPVGIHCRLLKSGRMELLAMVDDGRFISYPKSFLQFLFDMRGTFGFPTK